MSYTPDEVPFAKDQEKINAWVINQFNKLSSVLLNYEPEQIIYQTLHEAPAKPEEGMEVYADGSDWNPGAGKGKYYFDGNVWVPVIPFLRLDTAYNTTSIGSGVSMGTVPAGSIILPHHVNITTAYNAGTTNVLEVGTTGTANKYVAAGDVDETTIAFTSNITTGCGEESSDTEIFIKFTETGTAATAGASTVILPFIPDK